MKIPIIIVCEIDTKKYSKYKDNILGDVAQALRKESIITNAPITTYRFEKDIDIEDVVINLSCSEELPIVDWFGK